MSPLSDPETVAWAVARIATDPAARRKLSLVSPAFFDTYYCGMDAASHRERWLNTIFELREKACETGTSAKLLILAPRDHGKTELAITLMAHAVCCDRNIRVLIIGPSEGQACKRLARVKSILRSDDVVNDWCAAPEEGYGPFVPTSRSFDKQLVQWGESAIRVLRSHESVDPTIEAVGVGGSITGGHFDLIVIDDPEDYDSVRSATLREQRMTWLRGTVYPMLAAGGLLVLIGTRKAHSDTYSHALRDPTWQLIRDQAILRWPDKWAARYQIDEHGRQVIEGWDIQGDAQVLWPEARTIEHLLRAREEMGSITFAREMQNEVTDEEHVSFRHEWLESACTRGEGLRLYDGPWPEGLLIVQGWDPAFTTDKKVAETQDRDYSVGITWAADIKTRERYLLGIHRERGATLPVKKRNVVDEYLRFRPDAHTTGTILDHIREGWCYVVAMERNSAGHFLRIDIQDMATIPLLAHSTQKQKNDPRLGVPSLAPLFENERVVLPYGDADTRRHVDVLVQELHDLGVSAHDDTVYALWIAETVLRRALLLYDRTMQQGLVAATLLEAPAEVPSVEAAVNYMSPSERTICEYLQKRGHLRVIK